MKTAAKPAAAKPASAKPAAAPIAPAGGGAGKKPKTSEEIIEKKENIKRTRLVTYLAIRFVLEASCAIVVVLTMLWLTFQGTKIINLLGVSDIPPGLVYGLFPPDPPPIALSPPPPP
jgi:hypothetical protein